MNVFPPRNLGAGEPWGRAIEDTLRGHGIVVQGAKQLTENNSRTVQGSLAQLETQAQRTDSLVDQLSETIDRLPRHGMGYDSETGFNLQANAWVTAAGTTLTAPPDRAYAVITCEATVQTNSATGTPVGWLWMSLTVTANGSMNVAPTSVGIPVTVIETTSGIMRTGTVNHTFHLNDIAGEDVTVAIRLYDSTGGATFTSKFASITASAMFLKDESHIDANGTPPEYTEAAPPVVGGGGGGSVFKWPMNPDAINSRHSGGLSGAYGSAFGGPNTIRSDHNGLDFSWPPHFTAGMPIRAAADGVVTKAYWEPGGGGWAVEIKHSSRWYTGYYHAVPGSLRVSAGQTVKQGQHLMDAGESGNSTGPHLHFMVVDMAKTGSYWSSHVNPETFMAEHNPNDDYV